MKRIVITIVVLFGSPVWALTYMGPPASNVKQGELLLGFDYSNGKLDAEFKGNGVKGALRHVDNDLYLGKVGLVLSDGFEVFGRFGVGEIEELGNESAWGLGARATFIEKDDVSWGALFQLMSINVEETGHIGGYTLNGDFEINEYQFAIGPTFKHNGSSVYFGPFAHFIDGDADLVNHPSVDIEQESEFGLYIGVLWKLADNTSLSIEFQGTDDAKMGGIGLVHKFGGPSE
ncbi:MAG: hypothetical protein BBJ57_02545 [Desulfobacterales bacterium PC51MH44]|nr:MAG: hypothetical protein BBJ57_02545 [Desulfobacterales bacterium PC51MH44]